MSEAEQAAEIARTPLQRIVQPEEQACVLCSLASTTADFMTEVIIDVTGGQYNMLHRLARHPLLNRPPATGH